MQQVKTLFSESDRDAVNRAVQQAEAGTSAEIVPVVAASSGRYDRSEDIVGLWLALICMSVVWILCPPPDVQSGSWGAAHPAWHWAALAIAMVVGFIAGAMLGSRVDQLRYLFTPRLQMHEEVMLRARAVFYDSRVHHTAGSSGVLLYVSLFEQMAAVIADENVLKAVGQEKLNALCAEFTQRLRRVKPTQAMCETIQSVGQCLSPLLPRKADDVNELPDALLMLD